MRKLDEIVKTVSAPPPSPSPSPPPNLRPLTPQPEVPDPIVPETPSPAPEVATPPPLPNPANRGVVRPPATHGCKYCNFTADRLKLVYQHWEETHKLDGDKFAFAQVLGKKCRHCNAVVNGEKDMKDHFKQLHPEYVTISFQVANFSPYFEYTIVR